jgi:tetratricopeptide (TPR) repeat protein
MKLIALFLLLGTPKWVLADILAEADALYRKGDFKSAARVYQEIVQREPTNEKGQTGLIRALLKDDEVEAAQVRAREAQRILPSSSTILAAMGDVSFRTGDLSAAAKHYIRALQVNPSNGRAYLGMAKLHSSNFNRKSTLEMDRKAYENDPDDPEIVLAFATDLPAAEQIPLLEKYLGLASNETESRRDWVSTRLAFLKVWGDRPTWLLQGAPRTTTVELG